MAQTDEIAIDVIVNGKPAIKAINAVGASTVALANKTKTAGTDMGKSWAMLGAKIAIATIAISKGVQAQTKQVKAEIALTTALKINNQLTSDGISNWKDYASALQENTNVGDEAVLQQLAYLKTLKLTDEQTKDVIEASIDLSAATGLTLDGSVKNLAKTFSGLTGELGESMPAIKELTVEQLKAGKAVDVVSEAVKGQAAAFKQSDVGAWGAVVAKAGDAWESLGRTVLALGTDSGAFALLNGAIARTDLLLTRMTAGIKFLATLTDDSLKARKAYLEVAVEMLKKDTEIYGSDNVNQMREYKTELKGINKELGIKQIPVVDMGKGEISMWEALKQGIAEYSDEVAAVNKQKENMLNVGKKVAKGLEDAFVNMAMGAKTSFKDMTNSILADLIRMAVRKSIVDPLGDLLDFHTGTAEVKHTGGSIGSTKIPSFHTGMRSDERLAKLQVGEAVVNRGGASKNRGAIEAMNKGYSVGGNGGNVTTAEINFNVQAIDSASFNSYLVNNRGTIEGIINSSLVSNGSVRRTIKQVV